jgi:hypothetical protein
MRLASWVADVTGPLDGPLREITGGAWRALQRRSGDLPPVHPWQERRKFMAEARGRRWLVKFAGLGAIGACKLVRARQLAAAGFTQEPAGLCHGFLVEPWRDDLEPLALPAHGRRRERVLERLGDYLGFRARAFPAAPERGASLQALHAMGQHNTRAALGPQAAAAWDAWSPSIERLALQVQRVETDNRLQAWEWLVGREEVLKTDALDHHAGHDLVGCQDIAWDVAGALVELGLTGGEEARLVARVAQHSGRPVDADLCRFLRSCYAAFQLGHWTEARSACAAGDEAERIGTAVSRYTRALQSALGTTPALHGPGAPAVTA